MTPTDKDIRHFLSKYGSWGKRLIVVLERLVPEIIYVKNAGGWNIIKDDIERWETVAFKVLTGKASEAEKTEAIYLSSVRLPSIVSKLSVWYVGTDKIIEEKKNDAEKPVRKTRKTKKTD